MHSGKMEMTSDAETEVNEDGEMGDVHGVVSTDELGHVSKPGDRGVEDTGGGVTMGVVSLPPGACGAERGVTGENICCGEGRVWIFLVLGLMMLVFSGAVVGVYMTVRTLTSSLDEVEVMPTYVPVTAGGLAGLAILSLFCRRFKILVYIAVTLCCVSTLLCAITAILTGTHVVHPLLNLSNCRHIRSQHMCRCETRFEREGLRLDEVSTGDIVYLRMYGVSSCADVQDVLPGLLSTMIGVYGVLVLLGVVAAVIAILVYRTERHRKFLLQNAGYEDTYSSPSNPPSASSSSSSSENFSEHHVMLPMSSSAGNSNSNNNASSAVRQANGVRAANIYTNTNATDDDFDDDNIMTTSNVVISNSNSVVNSINNNNNNNTSSSTPELSSPRVKKAPISKDELKPKGKKISPTVTSTEEEGSSTPSDTMCSSADAPVGYIEACRMRRCHSFSQPRRRAVSPASSSSSSASFRGGGAKPGMGGTKASAAVGRAEQPSKLREHRKKGRRAVTLHGLDREQLLLILSLQMRYLQESDQVAKGEQAAQPSLDEQTLIQQAIGKVSSNPAPILIPSIIPPLKGQEQTVNSSVNPVVEIFNVDESPRVPGILKKSNVDPVGVAKTNNVANDNLGFLNDKNTMLNTAANAGLLAGAGKTARGKHYMGGFGSTPNLNKRSEDIFVNPRQFLGEMGSQVLKTPCIPMQQHQHQQQLQPPLLQHQQLQQQQDQQLLPSVLAPQTTSQSFQQLQRRAMTPTPRQERQSSSRAPEDNLMDAYLPASLVRSHTPQPYTPYQLRDGGVLFQYNGPPRETQQNPPQDASLLQPYVHEKLQQQQQYELQQQHEIQQQESQQDNLINLDTVHQQHPPSIANIQQLEQHEKLQLHYQMQQEKIRQQQLQQLQQQKQEQLLRKRQQQQLMLQQQQRQQQQQVAMMQQQQLEMLQQQWLQESQLIAQQQQQQTQLPPQRSALPPPLLPVPLSPQLVHQNYQGYQQPQPQRKMSDVSQTASMTASSITTATDAEPEDDEPATLITYDLRNVGTCGPIVYENTPMARSSISQGSGSYRGSPSPSSSNTSTLVRPPGIAGGHIARPGDQQVKGTAPPMPGTGPEPQNSPTNFTEDTNTPAADQTSGCQQMSRQISENSNASTTSDNVVSVTTSSDSGSSPTKKIAGLFSRSKTPPAQKKPKKMTKKERAALKQEVEAAANLAAAQAAAGAEAAALASLSPAGGGGPQLKRTDSTASGGKTDRWQIVLENGKTQGGKTLWENAQRKVVSDPQTPDSTLNQHQKEGRKFFAESPVQQVDAQQNQIPQHQPVLSGILKNAKAPSNVLLNSENLLPTTPSNTLKPALVNNTNANPLQPYPTHDLDPIPNPLFPDMSTAYPNPNPVYKDVSPNQHAFLPIANSSTDNYEDLAEMASLYKKQLYGGATLHQDLAPPPKPPRMQPVQAAHAINNPSMALSSQIAATGPNRQPQSMRPKSYITAMEPEGSSTSTVASGNNGRGPYRTDVPPEPKPKNIQRDGPNFYGDMEDETYAQPRRRSVPHGPIQQHQLSMQAHRQQQQQQQQHMRNGRPFQAVGYPYPQRSAFHTLGHAPPMGPSHSPSPSLSSANEACDTDLDDLPPPTWQSRYLRSQSFSPPPYAPKSLHQSMDAINKRASIRSNSSSSSDQHNTSMTSSERSFSTVGGGGSVRVRNSTLPGQSLQVQGRDRMLNYNTNNMNNNGNLNNNDIVADRRFCLTQQRPQQQQHQQQQYRLPSNGLEPVPAQIISNNSIQQALAVRGHLNGNGSDDDYMVMRRCQSVDDGPGRQRLAGQTFTQELGGVYLATPSEAFCGDLSNFVGTSSLNNLQVQNLPTLQPSPVQSPHTRPRQQQQQQQQLQPQHPQLSGLQAYQNIKIGSQPQALGLAHNGVSMATVSKAANQIQASNSTVLQLAESSDNDGEYSETVI